MVSTRHAGIKEAVLSGKTGFLVDELDITGMTDAMTTLALEPALAGQMGAQARRHVGEHYSMEVTIGTLSEILHKAAQRVAHTDKKCMEDKTTMGDSNDFHVVGAEDVISRLRPATLDDMD